MREFHGADIRKGDSVQFAGTTEWRTVESVQRDPNTLSLIDVRVSPLPNLPSVYSVARVQPVRLQFPEPNPFRYSVAVVDRATTREGAEGIANARNRGTGSDAYRVRPDESGWWEIILVLPRPSAN